jgi:hypothetical protein
MYELKYFKFVTYFTSTTRLALAANRESRGGGGGGDYLGATQRSVSRTRDSCSPGRKKKCQKKNGDYLGATQRSVSRTEDLRWPGSQKKKKKMSGGRPTGPRDSWSWRPFQSRRPERPCSLPPAMLRACRGSPAPI